MNILQKQGFLILLVRPWQTLSFFDTNKIVLISWQKKAIYNLYIIDSWKKVEFPSISEMNGVWIIPGTTWLVFLMFLFDMIRIKGYIFLP